MSLLIYHTTMHAIVSGQVLLVAAWECRTLGPSLAASLELVTYC